MAKDKISDYSTTANSNTDIGGINVDEGCAPSGINDAIRTLMAQLKTWQSGGQDVYITPAGSASVPAVTTTGDTNTGIFFPAADTVGITTGGTERIRFDSAGNAGLGVTPPASNSGTYLWNKGGASLSDGVGASYYGVVQNAVYNSGWKYVANGYAAYYVQDSAGNHSLVSAPSGTAGSAITFTSVLNVAKGKTLVLEGGASSSGTGVAFPATQSASSDANTLDDYEEGTWTVTASSSTGSITSYTAYGQYTKIGRQVFISAYVTVTNAGTAGGSLQISLPFTAPNTNGQFFYGVGSETLATGQGYQVYIAYNTATAVMVSYAGGAITWGSNRSFAFSTTYSV